MLIRDLTTLVTLQIVEGVGSSPCFSLPFCDALLFAFTRRQLPSDFFVPYTFTEHPSDQKITLSSLIIIGKCECNKMRLIYGCDIVPCTWLLI